MARDPSSVLAALGVDRAAEQLYFQLVPVSGHTVVGVARLVQTTPARLLDALVGAPSQMAIFQLTPTEDAV